MQTRTFAVIAGNLRNTRPCKEESVARWLQYQECVDAVANALREVTPDGKFKKQQFVYECFKSH